MDKEIKDNVKSFINEVNSICEKYNMVIESEDQYCGLMITLDRYNHQYNPRVLDHASVCDGNKILGYIDE